NGQYHFSLLPTLLDSDNIQLDQNANGVPGEPEDTYSFTLIVDTVPPHVAHHNPSGDIAGTITNIDIWFSEQIDLNKLYGADITIVNPTNSIIAVNSIREVGLNRFRIAFPPQMGIGTYHIQIGTNITDLAGNLLVPDMSQPVLNGVAYDASFNLVPV